MKKPFLFAALDREDFGEVVELAQELSSCEGEFGFKLNLDFFVNSRKDSHYFNKISGLKRPIFADLKMWNGERTMSHIARDLANRGVNYLNVYAHALEPFINGVVKAVEETGTDAKVLGLTVLTHYTEEDCQKLYGCSMRDAVRRLAKISYSAGVYGIIVPGTALESVKDLPIEKLVTAIRPKWYGKSGENHQKQEVYPQEAIKNGANLIVCGTPIIKSADRKLALQKTLEEMST